MSHHFFSSRDSGQDFTNSNTDSDSVLDQNDVIPDGHSVIVIKTGIGSVSEISTYVCVYLVIDAHYL